MDLELFFQAVLRQDAALLRSFFHEDAVIHWHCTNECFTVEEYIRANCEYPGQWDGIIERMEERDSLWIMACRVYPTDKSVSFHVVSFIRLAGEKIAALDEYWADDGLPPMWRRQMSIGKPIHSKA